MFLVLVHTIYLAFIILSFVVHLATSGGGKNAPTAADLEDNEFAEFEEFDDEDTQKTTVPGVDRGGGDRSAKTASKTPPGSPSPGQKPDQQSKDETGGFKVPQQQYKGGEEEVEEEEDDQDHEGIVEVRDPCLGLRRRGCNLCYLSGRNG